MAISRSPRLGFLESDPGDFTDEVPSLGLDQDVLVEATQELKEAKDDDSVSPQAYHRPQDQELDRLSSSAVEEDNRSILSKSVSASSSHPMSRPLSPVANSVRGKALSFGLHRSYGSSRYNDYDVVTVHGLRDDQETTWTSYDNSNWIRNKLFPELDVRQLDYSYATDESARVYDTDGKGIDMEANALLHDLARFRAELPETEFNRPIIWICHDIGGTIVKQALINSFEQKPPARDLDSPSNEGTADLRLLYRKIAMNSSTMIFLGCPHRSHCTEILQDQLNALLSVPGPPIHRQILRKLKSLAFQIEKVNREFLDTKLLDRVNMFNIFSLSDEDIAETTKHQSELADDSQPPQTSVSTEQPTAEHHSELFSNSSGSTFAPFSRHSCSIWRNFESGGSSMGIESDHRSLVRGSTLSDIDDWVTRLAGKLNQEGCAIDNSYEFLDYQQSLLSLAPPTWIADVSEPETTPPLVSWILEHEVFQQFFKLDGTQVVFLHTGLGALENALKMRAISQQLYIALDSQRESRSLDQAISPVFYFDFDRHDSRRRSIRDMIISFMCAFACRFWSDNASELNWETGYLRMFQCWSLADLMDILYSIRSTDSMDDVVLFLGNFDQCDERERMIFLRAETRRQNSQDRYCRLLITSNSADQSIVDLLPPSSIICLKDYPLPLSKYLSIPPASSGHPDDTIIRRLLALTMGPEFVQFRPLVNRTMKQFEEVPGFVDRLQELLANCDTSPEVSGQPNVKTIINGMSSYRHHIVFRLLADTLNQDKQKWIRNVCDWITHAAEPLTLEILTQAIELSSFAPAVATQTPDHIYHQFHDMIQQSIGDFVVLDGRDIKFAEDSFYETDDSGLGADSASQRTCRAQADMATVCLRYLLSSEGSFMLSSLSAENLALGETNSSNLKLPRHSLVSYALRFWTVHYWASGDHRPTNLAMELFQDKYKRNLWIEALYGVSNPFTRIEQDYISSLPYMAMLGLDDLLSNQIELEKASKGWSKNCWLAITEASRNGHRKSAEILLDAAEPDPVGLSEAIRWAANYGQGGVLDLLIPRALTFEGFQWPPYILNRAAAIGLDSLVSTLVKVGHCLNEPDGRSERLRPIHNAIAGGWDDTVMILLGSKRVDLTLPDGTGNTPLALASSIGTPETIRQLIAAGASLDVYKPYGGSLLQTAIDHAQHESLRVLLDAQCRLESGRWDVNRNTNEDGATVPIVEAAGSGRVVCTRILLERGADPNNDSHQEGSALYRAIANGPYVDTCRMLLEHGASPNQSASDHKAYSDRNMLLLRAIETKVRSLVVMLLDHGADINAADPSRKHIQPDSPLAFAVKCGNYDIVELLLERGANPAIIPDGETDSWSPLFTAAKTDCEPRVLELLIKHNADVNWKLKADGWAVLHAAYNAPEKLAILLEHGADVNATDGDNWTTLMIAAANNDLQSIDALLNYDGPKADLEVQASGDTVPGSTALTLACENGHFKAAKLLIEAGANTNHQRSDGKFALGLLLKHAWKAGLSEVAVELFFQHKPNLSLADHDGNTVMHCIHPTLPPAGILRLVEEGAPVGAINNAGYNSLAWAVSCSNYNVARYLTMFKGVRADISHPDFGSILHMAVVRSSLDLVRDLVRAGADHSVVDSEFGESVLYSTMGNPNSAVRWGVVQYLVEELGVDVNASGGKWIYPHLRLVAEHLGGDRLLEYLLKHGASKDITDDLGRTLAHWAAVHGEIEYVRVLSGAGVDFSICDKFGRMPLHFAAANGNLEVLRFLIKSLATSTEGLNIDVADTDGWTPLMWGCRSLRPPYAAVEVMAREYKADLWARSKDNLWSPLKIARFYNWSESEVKVLVPAADVSCTTPSTKDKAESQWETHSHEIEPGSQHEERCLGCSQAIVGDLWSCVGCQVFLCFKCLPHSKSMHDPDHEFEIIKEASSEAGKSEESSEIDETHADDELDDDEETSADNTNQSEEEDEDDDDDDDEEALENKDE